ncbi:MAG: aminoacyl-tRNA hydrolase [Deltaproteobacteria bacterium]|nr:aminoacyl-tRNA hydrolase [Deltaproteobacteria bacterium]
MWMVVGLGNPGAAYASTRHNVGFMVIDRLAQRWHAQLDAVGATRAAHADVRGRPVLLVQPQRYMNRSGEALASLPDPATDGMIAIFDDLDLPIGRLRVRSGGGSGGHRGVQSLLEHWGAEFVRVRVGIGRPAPGQRVDDYVLTPPDEKESAALTAALERAADAVECVLGDGLIAAMNRFNGLAAVEQ